MTVPTTEPIALGEPRVAMVASARTVVDVTGQPCSLADTYERVMEVSPDNHALTGSSADTLLVEFAQAPLVWQAVAGAGLPVASVSSFQARLVTTERPLLLSCTAVPSAVILPAVAQAMIEVRALADAQKLRHVDSWEEFVTALDVVATASTLWFPIRSEVMGLVEDITADLTLGVVPEVSPAAHTLAVLLADDIRMSVLRGLGHAVPSALMSGRLVETALALHDDPIGDSARPERAPLRRLPAVRPVRGMPAGRLL